MKTEVNNYIRQLYDNRIMDSNEEFELFEDAISNLADIVEIENIPMLCTVFDDKTKENEVMFGLIHLIEKFSEKESVDYIVKGIMKILDYAYEWAIILTMRILNSDDDRKVYKRVINEMENGNKEQIIIMLERIVKDNPQQFNEKVLEVIN
jgi:hypothetical protein